MTTDPQPSPGEIVAKLTKEVSSVVRRADNRFRRAGELCHGHGGHIAHTVLKRWPNLFERHFHQGWLKYRLTPLGLAVRAELERGEKG